MRKVQLDGCDFDNLVGKESNKRIFTALGKREHVDVFEVVWDKFLF